MRNQGIDGVEAIYDKTFNNEFNGMLFVKFSSEDKRASGMLTFNTAKLKMFDRVSRMNHQRPIQDRVSLSTLNGIKRLLVEWKFTKSSVQFDEDTRVLSVGGQEVLKVEVEQFQLKLNWIDDTWAQWQQLTSHDDFKALVATNEEKLIAAQKRMDKGKGKGHVA